LDPELVDGRYRLGPLLGSGGQGSTYAAVDQQTNRRVAIKTFSLDVAKDWKALELFKRECRVLAELHHPGIPSYIDEIQDEDSARLHLVMDLVPGESLRKRLVRKGPLGEEEIWTVLEQLTRILAYLHGREPPIVHRDIKPANIVQQPDGRLSLVDFGAVRSALRTGHGSTMIGTFGYMAPEQLHGEATPATDLYGLGATIVNLASGLEPEDFKRKGLKMDLTELPVSADLRTLLNHLIEPNPEERPVSGAALEDLLESGYRREPQETPPHPETIAREEADGTMISPRLPDLPQPARAAVGFAVWLFGLWGALALTVLSAVMLPILFTIAHLAVSGERAVTLREREREMKDGLKEARGDLLRFTTGWGSGKRRRRQQRQRQRQRRQRQQQQQQQRRRR
jgi:serine/threonine protein kinase